MSDKIINLFGENGKSDTPEVKYSKLLELLLEPFSQEFIKFKYQEDIFEIGILAWNLANFKAILPQDDFKKMLAATEKSEDLVLIKKLVAHKLKNYRDYTKFIVDFEIEQLGSGINLKVVAETEESFLANLMDQEEENFEEFIPNYINRSGICLRPKQPFIDWVNKVCPNEVIEQIEEANIYLVSDNIGDLDRWLRKKFDTFFSLELEDWHTNKKDWPQRRTYKIFKEWFHVEQSSMIYDLESKPVFKSE